MGIDNEFKADCDVWGGGLWSPGRIKPITSFRRRPMIRSWRKCDTDVGKRTQQNARVAAGHSLSCTINGFGKHVFQYMEGQPIEWVSRNYMGFRRWVNLAPLWKVWEQWVYDARINPWPFWWHPNGRWMVTRYRGYRHEAVRFLWWATKGGPPYVVWGKPKGLCPNCGLTLQDDEKGSE